MDVLFHEYMADEMGTVERVYETAGIELTDEARADIGAYVAAHPRGKEGRVVYDLEGDFGVTAAELRDPFGEYLDGFPIRIEVP